ncbi:MAG: hypothetical protein AAF557_27715 [Pseudomonadota bacterium]
MEQAEIRRGKERVRELVIAPLEADGMIRTKRTVADHDAFLERVERALCYMSEDGLQTVKLAISALCKACSRCKRREGWPSVQAIRSQAHAIELPPATMSPMITSYMRSSAGRRALEEGDAVAAALVRYMRRRGYVPTRSNGGWEAIRREAADWRRDAERRVERINAGVADAVEREIQRRYQAAIAAARALVHPEGEKADAA